jgi:hypothetical protein
MKSKHLARVGFTLIILACCADAGASAIRTAAKPQAKASAAQVSAYWNRFYSEALQQHRMQIRGLNALKVLRVNADGTLPQIPMVAYLQWRRSLNPVRFDRYHPQLGSMLVRDQVIRNVPDTTNPNPGGVNPPPQVPEPSSFAIAAVFAVVGIAVRRRFAQSKQ